MLICQGYWEQVGLDVDVRIVETGKFYDLMFSRADSPDDECVGQIWPWINPTVFQNVYHSSNMFTSLGVHTTCNDPEMDELYNAVLAETDIERQSSSDRIHDKRARNGHRDRQWQVPTYWVVSPELGDFTKRAHIFWTNALFAVTHAE
jgi:ABC-type transport system substrate-binding protein